MTTASCPEKERKLLVRKDEPTCSLKRHRYSHYQPLALAHSRATKHTEFDRRESIEMLISKAHHIMGSNHYGHKPLKVSKNTRRLRYPSMAKHLLGRRAHFDYLHPEHVLTRTLHSIHVLCDMLHNGANILVCSQNTTVQLESIKKAQSQHSPLEKRACNHLHQHQGDADIQEILSTRYSNLLEHEKRGRGTKHISSNRRLVVNEYGWLCGSLTNWGETEKTVWRVSNFSERLNRFAENDHVNFPRYRQKENASKGFIFYDEFRDLCLSFRNKPDLVIVFDAVESASLVREASALKIPVMAIADSHADLTGILYPLPANSESIHLLTQFCTLIHQSSKRLNML